jgi:hypothetical protein
MTSRIHGADVDQQCCFRGKKVPWTIFFLFMAQRLSLHIYFDSRDGES